MSKRYVRSVRQSVLAAACALAAMAAQPACVVVGTCPAADEVSLLTDLRLTNGGVQKPGRNPPSRYFCPDLGLAAASAARAPDANYFELQYRDLHPRATGHVSARLMRKSRSTGAAYEVQRLESAPSATVTTTGATVLERWDLERFTYFVLVDLSSTSDPVEAHSVCLVAR